MPDTNLPRYHVPRPRLTDVVAGARVVLVEAGSGYGKSSLAAEAAATLGGTTLAVPLRAGTQGTYQLPVAILRTLRSGGLLDVAGRVEAAQAAVVRAWGPGDEGAVAAGTDAALDALVDALARDGFFLVIDDAHHADAATVDALDGLARRLPTGVRLAVLARHLPRRLAALRTVPGACTLDAGDLAFTDEEVQAVCVDGLGLAMGPRAAADLRRATGGWAVATVIGGRRGLPDPSPGDPRAGSGGDVLTGLVDDLVADLDDTSAAGLRGLAGLPLLDRRLVGDLTGDGGLWDRCRAAGVPIVPVGGRWSEILAPVAERLSGPLDPVVARAAADLYMAAGEIEAAVRTLIDAGDADEAAARLAGLDPAQADQLDLTVLEHLVSTVPAAALESHPGVWVQLARAAEVAGAFGRRGVWLEAASRRAEPGSTLAAEVDVEVARDLVQTLDLVQAGALLDRHRELAGGNPVLRARLLAGLGGLQALTRDPASLRHARDTMTEAAVLCRQLGARTWLARVLQNLGCWVNWVEGRYDEAVAALDEALAVLPLRSRQRGLILTFRAEVLIDCGRYDEGAADVDEAERLAEIFADGRIAAYASWDRARAASQQGDREATLDHLRTAERQSGDWFAHGTGVDFLADAADLLDRVGEVDLAGEYLVRAEQRRDEDPRPVDLAAGTVAARHGDARIADDLLRSVSATAGYGAQQEWRLLLLRAFAALRRGDPEAGALAASAFEKAAALGRPDLPRVRESEVTDRIAALAASTGLPAAVRLATSHARVTISLLGRWEVTVGGRPRAVRPGQPASLLKLVAVRGGRMTVDEVIDTLWPDDDPEKCRARLRVVLHRARVGEDELVHREGDSLVLAPGTEVDADLFEREATHVLAQIPAAPMSGAAANGARRSGSPALIVARSAVWRYRGDLLPDDRYEPWTEQPREILRQRYLQLCGLLTDAAEAAGDADDALRHLALSVAADPLDEKHHLRQAALLLGQGRRRAAQQALDRAADVAAELGVDPGPAWYRLLAAVGA